MRYSSIRAISRAILFLAWTGATLSLYLPIMLVSQTLRGHLTRWYFKGCLILTGLRLRVHGTPAKVALYTANHGTYLDIPVLGAVLSHGQFVAKNEVADWPLFGLLARVGNALFISRAIIDSAQECVALAARINAGSSMIMFPEGTSTRGDHILPFKSALFAALEHEQTEHSVQPVTIVYARHHNGVPLTQEKREYFTWFGDTVMAPHLWGLLGLKGCEVDVIFHAPVSARAFAGRKPLAKHCETTVRTALDAVLADGAVVVSPASGNPVPTSPEAWCSDTP